MTRLLAAVVCSWRGHDVDVITGACHVCGTRVLEPIKEDS